jgi:hypothetical protein
MPTANEIRKGNWIANLLTAAGFTIGAGGGGGGSSDVLVRAIGKGTSSVTVNPDPAAPTLISGMTVDLSLASTKTVGIFYHADFTSTGGGSRTAIYVDGVLTWPQWGVGSNVEVGWFEDIGDGAGLWVAEGLCIIELAAGDYTIEIKESASGSTNPKTWYNRLLEVRDYTP